MERRGKKNRFSVIKTTHYRIHKIYSLTFCKENMGCFVLGAERLLEIVDQLSDRLSIKTKSRQITLQVLNFVHVRAFNKVSPGKKPFFEEKLKLN